MLPSRTTLLSLVVLAAALAWSTAALATQHEPCIPNCVEDAKVCGFDGCSSDCGTCVAPEQCSADGKQCELSCAPYCPVGYTCGGDGCGTGGTCGTCLPGQQCYQNQCTGNCVPQCASKVCGPDGCELGFVCGFCGDDEMCNDLGTACVPCVADCYMPAEPGVKKQCGDDGCGDECGLCFGDYVCDELNFMCVECGGPGFPCDDPVVDPNQPCEPTCAGADCGPDGCGGSCGVCDFGQTCLHGLCADCTPTCEGVECGGDGCGGSCDTCEPGLSCIEGLCSEGPCVPDCGGRSCGDDGCDGTCGECPTGQECGEDGHCSGADWSEREGGGFNPCASDEIWDELAEGCVIDTSGSGALKPPGQGDGGCASQAGGTGLLALLLAALALGLRRRDRRRPVPRRRRA